MHHPDRLGGAAELAVVVDLAAEDVHQLGLAEVAALLRCQPELVRVISRLQEAAHPQVVCIWKGGEAEQLSTGKKQGEQGVSRLTAGL